VWQAGQYAEQRGRARLAGDFDREADKTLALVGEMAGMGQHGGEEADKHQDGEPASPAVEWEDTMNAMNRRSSPKNTFWKLIDRESGAENHMYRLALQGRRSPQAADRERSPERPPNAAPDPHPRPALPVYIPITSASRIT
jgi:hypothetical protein